MTIRLQLIIVVAACLLPAALASALLIRYSYERQRENIEQSRLETARALTQAVDRELASAQAALQSLATSPYLASGDLEAFHRQAREVLELQPGNGIVLADASGRQVMSTIVPYGAPLPRSGIPHVVSLVFDTARPATADFYIGATSKRAQVAVAVPVFREGRVVYALAMGFLPERLGKLLRPEKLPAGSVATILDSQGTIVARTLDPDRHVGHKGEPDLLEQVARVPEGRVETSSLEGIPAAAVFSRSATSNWSVAIGVPRSLLTRELWTSISWIIAGTIVLLVSGIALAQVLSMRITRSIRGLIAPAAALARGEKVVVAPLRLQEAEEVGRALRSASGILREREEILAVVAHDLRNPLAAIMLDASTAALLTSQVPGADDLRALLAKIANVAGGMSGMVDDLLAVAVSTSGGGSMLEIAPVSPSSVLQRAADSVRSLLQRKGIELEIESLETVPDVQADEDRILRVFVNLLDNALKFTQPSGRVVLRAEAQANRVRFSVANSGPALSEQERDRMFQPFWQARPKDQRGAGLGLSICRSIIETHGGRIWAEPEAGMRVRICFELPRATQSTYVSQAFEASSR